MFLLTFFYGMVEVANIKKTQIRKTGVTFIKLFEEEGRTHSDFPHSCP